MTATPSALVSLFHDPAGPQAGDHWHRTERDPGRQYKFKDAATLIDDYFN
jgi:hypothetical protein